MGLETKIPSHQRAAVNFIDMQILHLEAQIEKLKEARSILSFGISDIGEEPRAAPKLMALPITAEGDEDEEAREVVGKRKRAPRVENLEEKIARALHRQGELRMQFLCDVTGASPYQISKAIHHSWFAKSGERSTTVYRLSEEGKRAMESEPTVQSAV